MRVVAVKQAALRSRADPRYLRMSDEVAQKYAAPKFPLVPLGSLLAEPIAYGTSDLLRPGGVGFPTLRMNNITADGWDTSDIKFLDCDRASVEKLILKTGDILVNRTNGSMSLVGKAARFDFDGEWLFASYLLRIRVDESRALSAFVTSFLNSPAGRLQIERLARPIAMINISPPELSTILIPLPGIEEQQRLVLGLTTALKSRVNQREQARKELLTVGEDLLNIAGVSFPPGTWPREYGVPTNVLRRVGSLGPQAYHPERAAVVEAVRAASAAEPRQLDSIAEIVSVKRVPKPGESCVGLSAVESDTGELLANREETSDAKVYEAGDVLFCRLRPYLNKVHRATSAGICSTEFYVLRPHQGTDPDWLAVTLRSRATLAQTRHLQTGNTHPRVPEADFRRLWIPLIGSKEQKEVARRLKSHQKVATNLRESADREWRAAEERFDTRLLGAWAPGGVC